MSMPHICRCQTCGHLCNPAPSFPPLEGSSTAADKIRQLRKALAELLAVIAVDDLIPESVSYMQQAWAALRATDET